MHRKRVIYCKKPGAWKNDKIKMTALISKSDVNSRGNEIDRNK